MEKKMTKQHFILLIIIFTVLCLVITKGIKHYKFKQLLSCLNQNDFEKFFSLADSRLTKLLFQPYNLEYLKLNALLMKQDAKAIDTQFDKLLRFKLTKIQKADLLSKAFSYYLKMTNKQKCQSLLKEIQMLDDPSLTKEAQKMYAIILEGNTNYIQETEEKLRTANKEEKTYLSYLLAIQYKNLKDKQKSKELKV